jgi:Peptidase family C25
MARHVDKAIICHRGALRAKYGADGLAAIRAALGRMAEADRAREISSRLIAIDRAGTMKGLRGPTVTDPTDAMAVKGAVDAAADGVTAHYVMLLGAPDVLPQQRLRNPTGDDDPDVPSDLPYACRAAAGDDPADFVGPVRAVGRLTDLLGATEPSYLVRLIDRAATWTPRAPSAYQPVFGLSTDSWKRSTRLSVGQLGTDGATIHVSPVEGPTFPAADLRLRSHFVNCHGGDTDPRWYGERTGTASLPVALEPASVRGNVRKGTVVAVECCYGAQHYRPDLAGGQMSLAATYLHEGAAGVLGASTLAYGPVASMGSADLITRYFLAEVHDGASLGRALLEARQRFVREHGELDPVDLKTLVQFDLLGDPSITPVRVPLPKSAPKALQPTSTGTRLRRQALARIGTGLADVVVRAAPDPVRAAPARVRAAADRAGVTPPPAAEVRTYRASTAVPSRTSFHLLAAPGGSITVVREEPGQPTTARTVMRK